MRQVLFAAFLLALSAGAFAQSNQSAMHVRFGHSDGQSVPFSDFVTFPKLEVMNPTCTIAGFSMVMVTTGKNVVGPFVTKGGKLTEAEIKLVNDNPNSSVRLQFDDVMVKCGEVETKSNGVIIDVKK